MASRVGGGLMAFTTVPDVPPSGAERPDERVPSDRLALTAWFADGVRALERSGGPSQHELISGRLVEARSRTQAIFDFVLADAARVPEDAGGRLKTDTADYTASVIGQEANRLRLQVEGSSPVPPESSAAPS